MLFDKVNKGHRLLGIKNFEEIGLPNGLGSSLTCDLVYDDKHYPIKAIMVYSNYDNSMMKIERCINRGEEVKYFKVLMNDFKSSQ